MLPLCGDFVHECSYVGIEAFLDRKKYRQREHATNHNINRADMRNQQNEPANKHGQIYNTITYSDSHQYSDILNIETVIIML